MIADLPLERIHHPYDGGADVLLPTTAERDTLMHRHAGRLSRHTEYLDVAALADNMGTEQAARTLADIDEFYADRHDGGRS